LDQGALKGADGRVRTWVIFESKARPGPVGRKRKKLQYLVTCITIVATANHFLTDAFIGALVPLLGWRINRVVLVLKPIQDYIFAPLINRLDLVDSDVRVVPKTL